MKGDKGAGGKEKKKEREVDVSLPFYGFLLAKPIPYVTTITFVNFQNTKTHTKSESTTFTTISTKHNIQIT